MLHADLSFDGQPSGSSGKNERPSDLKGLLHNLTSELQSARVRQNSALEKLEHQVRTLEASQARGMPVDWDQASADALAALYDFRSNEALPGFSQATFQVPQSAHQDLREIYQRIGDLDAEISRALQNVAHRQDLDGLRAIEGQVRDLTQQVESVKGQLSRLASVEALVRDVAWQVSDERLQNLVSQGGSWVDDLEAMARHQDDRQDELRRFIQTTITEWREAEARARETAQDLNSKRHETLATLIETSISERRAAEAQAMSVLGTLQGSLANVLERIEVLEAKGAQSPQTFVTSPASSVSPSETEAIAAHDGWALRPDEAYQRPPIAHPRTSLTLNVDPMASEASSVSPAADGSQSRRDMLLEVHRAKLKAAALRNAEAEAAKGGNKKPRKQSPAGRLPGSPSTLLAAALAVIVAINGGLLFLSRKEPPASTITIEPLASAAPHAEEPMPAAAEPREAAVEPAQPQSPVAIDEAPVQQQPNQFGYGYYGNPIEETHLPVPEAPSEPPKGMTVEASPRTATEEAMAQTYENQVLAGLSGDVGVAASQSSPADLLPEKSGRVDAALTVEEPNRDEAKAEAQPQEEASTKSLLDIPPVTVGPQSLRLAAANGNAAAEFEVATRMAEGNGTPQDPKEAFRWYQRSASRGFVQAQYRVGTFYERGLAVPRDLSRAMVWYQRAAEQGNVKAMHNLAVLAAGGVNGNPDYKTALVWFTKAANYGLADSQYNLAVLFENGLGPSADHIVAYKWYALAAKGGDKDAADRRDALHKSLSANQLKAAEGLIAAFHAEVSDKLANEPLAAQEAWKREANNQPQ